MLIKAKTPARLFLTKIASKKVVNAKKLKKTNVVGPGISH